MYHHYPPSTPPSAHSQVHLRIGVSSIGLFANFISTISNSNMLFYRSFTASSPQWVQWVAALRTRTVFVGQPFAHTQPIRPCHRREWNASTTHSWCINGQYTPPTPFPKSILLLTLFQFFFRKPLKWIHFRININAFDAKANWTTMMAARNAQFVCLCSKSKTMFVDCHACICFTRIASTVGWWRTNIVQFVASILKRHWTKI